MYMQNNRSAQQKTNIASIALIAFLFTDIKTVQVCLICNAYKTIQYRWADLLALSYQLTVQRIRIDDARIFNVSNNFALDFVLITHVVQVWCWLLKNIRNIQPFEFSARSLRSQ